MWHLLLLAATAGAVTIQSRSPAVNTVDGVVQATQQLTFRCDASDYGTTTPFSLTKTDGTTGTLSVTCGPVEDVFQLTQVGVVPRGTRAVVREVCSTWRPGPDNTNNLLRTAPGSGGARRRLLAWYDVAVDYLEGAACANPIVAGVTAVTGGCDRGGGISQAQFDQLKAEQETLKDTIADRTKSIENLQNASKAWDRGILDNALATQNVSRALANVANATNAKIDTVVQRQDAMDTALKSLSIATRTQIADINTNFANVQANIANISQSLQAQIIVEFNHSYTALGAMQTSLTNAINDVRDQTASNFENAYLRERIIARGLRDLIGTVDRLYKRVEELRTFTRQFIASFDNTPVGFTPFLYDTGTPAEYVDASDVISVEDVRVLFVNGGNTARQVTFSYVCNARALVARLDGWYTWKDFIEGLGPAGCDISLTFGAAACGCYVQVQERSCSVRVNGTNSPDWVDDVKLTGNTCSSSITVQPTQTFVNGTAFLASLSSTCLDAGSTVLTVGVSMQQKQFTFANQIASCATSYSNLNSPPSGAALPFTVLAMWESAYALTQMNKQILIDRFDGILPGGISFVDEPFQRRDNQPASCARGAYVAYSNEVVPVYRITPVSASATVTASVTGMASVTTDNVLIGSTIDGLLPDGGSVVLGDPRSVTQIFNAPNNMLPLGGLASSRQGTYTYPMMPNAGNMTLAAWESLYRTRFDAFAAMNSADSVLVDVNATSGACVNGAALYAGVGSWCDVRGNFVLQNVTGNSNAFKLIPRSGGSYLATLTVVEGTITQEFLSACPVLNVQGTGTGASLTLINSRATAIPSFVFVNEGLGASYCETAFPQVTVPPTGSVTLYVPRCVGATQFATVRRLASNGTVVPCPGLTSVNITTTLLSFEITNGVFAQKTIDLQRITQASAIANATATQMQAAVDAQVDAVIAYLQSRRLEGIPVDNSSYLAFLGRIQGMKDALNASLAALRPYVTVNDSDTQAAMDAFERANQEAINNMKAADERLKAAMQDLSRQLDEQSTTLDALNKTLADLEVARAAYVEAERRFGDILTNFTKSVVTAFGELIKKPALFGFGDLFGDLLRGIASVGSDVWDAVKDVIKEALGLPKELFDGLIGGLSGALILTALGLCAVSIGLVAYLKCQMNRLDRKIDALSGAGINRATMGSAGRTRMTEYEETDPFINKRG